MDGVSMPCSVVQGVVNAGGASQLQSCYNGSCTVIRYVAESDSYEQLVGWQQRTLLQMGDTTANVWAPVWQDSNQDLNLMLLAAGQFPPGANPAAQAAKQAARGYPRTSLPPTPRPV